MKVLKKEEIKQDIFPIRIQCENCGVDLDVESIDDVEYGYLGAAYVRCPECTTKTYSGLESLDQNVTMNNVKFPDHFYYFGNGKELSSEEIQNYIREIIKHFREDPEAFCSHTGSGNTMVFGFNFSGDKEYVFYVVKDYYETSIDYENVDVKLQEKIGWGWKNVPTSNTGIVKIPKDEINDKS